MVWATALEILKCDKNVFLVSYASQAGGETLDLNSDEVI